MLKDNELSEVRGGIKYGIIGAVIAGITFIIGVIDGYQRPLACRK